MARNGDIDIIRSSSTFSLGTHEVRILQAVTCSESSARSRRRVGLAAVLCCLCTSLSLPTNAYPRTCSWGKRGRRRRRASRTGSARDNRCCKLCKIPDRSCVTAHPVTWARRWVTERAVKSRIRCNKSGGVSTSHFHIDSPSILCENDLWYTRRTSQHLVSFT